MRLGWLAVLAAALAGGSSWADEAPTLLDFAYGMELRVDGARALYQVPVPIEVYRSVTRGDLGDVAVFNAAGELVPFALQTPEAVPTPATRVALPVFPVLGPLQGRAEGISVRVRRDSSGSVLEVYTGDTPAPERGVVAYLVDMQSMQRPVTGLSLEWTAPLEGFVGRMSVEASDDLDHWRVLARGAPLASLRYGRHALERRQVALPQTSARYLKLSWSQKNDPATIIGVTAELAPDTSEPPLQWLRVPGLGRNEERSGRYHFDAGARLPVDRARVILPQQNTLAELEILSRDSQDAAWRRRGGGLAYRLKVEGTAFDSPDFAVVSGSDRYWRLEVDPRGGGLGRGVPELELGWVPHRLVFVARGEGPFTLACGSARVDARRYRADALLADLTRRGKDALAPRTASVGVPRTLGGEELLRAAPPPFPWKQWLLWAVLLLGVALLAWMAARLYRRVEGSR